MAHVTQGNAFRQKLGHTVWIVRLRRAAFVNDSLVAQAVDVTGADQQQSGLRIHQPDSLQDIDRPLDINQVELPRPPKGFGRMRERRQVKDIIRGDVRDVVDQAWEIQKVARQDANFLMVLRPGSIKARDNRALLKKLPAKVAADETRDSRNQAFHRLETNPGGYFRSRSRASWLRALIAFVSVLTDHMK